MRKEAGTTDVFAGLVGFNAVGLADIVGYGTEVIRVRCRCDVYRDYPLEAVTGGAGEEQLCLEVWIFKESGASGLWTREVVEIYADQP